MKIRLLLAVVFLIGLGSVPAVAQQHPLDQGNADTALFVVTPPSAAGNDSLVTVELWFYNDVQTIGSFSMGFSWDNPNLQLDTAIWSPAASSAWDFIRLVYYKNNVDSSNANQLFQGVGGRLFTTGLFPQASRQLVLSYNFTLSDWTVDDSLCFKLEGFNAFSFVDANSNAEYEPIWGGDICVFDPDRPEPKTLEATPTSLDFNGVAGGFDPAAQNFQITEVGGDNIDYDATAPGWLTLTNAAGTTPAMVGVQPDITGLAAGDYLDSVQVTSTTAGNEVWVYVNVHLDPGNQAPVLEFIGDRDVDENQLLEFAVTASDPDQTVPTLMVSVEPGTSSFTDNGDGTGTFNWMTGFDDAGDYSVTFTASDGDLTDEETITITVNNINRAPAIADAPDQQVSEGVNLNFGVSASDPDMTTLTLTAAPLPGDATFDDAGDGTGTFDWTPSATDAGVYDVWFFVTDGELADSDMVTIEVLDADGLVVSPGLLVFVADFGGDAPAPASFSVSVSDGSLVPFDATETATWFSIDPMSGSTPASVEVTVDNSGLPGGLYRDSILITSGDFDAVYAHVQLTVNYNALVEPDTLFFEVWENSMVPSDPQYVTIRELHDGVVEWIAPTPSAPWVILADTTGMTGVIPDTLEVSVSTFDLMVGEHFAFIPIDVNGVSNSNHEVVVKVTVMPCATLLPTEVVFNTTIFAGETAMASELVEITSSGGTELSFVGEVSDYFTFTPNSGTTPMNVDIAYERTFMTEGVYADTVVIMADIDPEIVDCPSHVMVISNVAVNRAPSADTVIVVNTPAVPGMRVGVPVVFTNSCPLSNFSLVLAWESDLVHFDSVSFIDAAFEYVDDKGAYETTFNDMNQVTLFANTGAQPMLPFGSEQLAGTLFFSLSCEIDAGTYGFTIGEDSASPSIQFVRDCGEGSGIEIPEYLPGAIIVGTASNYVCGYVVDPFDNEIEGATVELWEDFPFTAPLMTTTSSGIGSFAFDEVMVIPFDLYAYKEGYYPGRVEDINFGDLGIKIVLHPIPDLLVPTSEWVDYFCPEGTNMFLGAPVPVGAIVEAFNQDNALVGQKMVQTSGQYGFMPVYRASELFGDDGASTGDAIRFTINGMDAIATGNTTYPAEYAQMEVCLEVRGTVTKSCTLFAGWNLISWNVNTDTDDILTVLDPIMNYVDVVLGFEQGGLTFDPDLQIFSTLWDVDHYSGYWIRIEGIDEVTLEVSGLPQDHLSVGIPLTPGWNLVSFLPDEAMPTEAALVYSGPIFEFAYGFPNGSIEVWEPGGQFNQLLNFEPCNGYWLKVDNFGILKYTGAVPASPEQKPANRGLAMSAGSEIATTSWVNLYSQDLRVNGEAVTSGATIKAFSVEGDREVGSFTMKADAQFGFMPVYASQEEAEGLNAGEEFYLSVNGVATDEVFTWTNNGDRIEVTALSTAGSTGEMLPDGFSLGQNYPNPFNPATNIEFTMPQTGTVKIEIFNVLGRSIGVILNGRVEAGTHTVVWDGRDSGGSQTASGVYFYRMTTDNYTETRKMMLLK